MAPRVPAAAAFDQQWQTCLGLKRDMQTDDLSAIAGGRFAVMHGAMREGVIEGAHRSFAVSTRSGCLLRSTGRPL